ncbi:unnamed protein product [Enterobius vermicularis]|uniref:Aa_trans domain-containing protein n=1 Tax=Enterobius vermicularis TaxID=51028 RepID=A0A0N4VR93_ENTVE|nr:unnamed protein product [Enterobius vermicularis]
MSTIFILKILPIVVCTHPLPIFNDALGLRTPLAGWPVAAAAVVAASYFGCFVGCTGCVPFIIIGRDIDINSDNNFPTNSAVPDVANSSNMNVDFGLQL